MSVQREAEKCKISSSRVVKSELPVGWPFFVVFCRYMEYFKKLTSYPLLTYLGLQTDKVWVKSIFWPWPHFFDFPRFLLTFTLKGLENFAKVFKFRSDRIFPKRHLIFRSCATVWKCSALIADLLGWRKFLLWWMLKVEGVLLGWWTAKVPTALSIEEVRVFKSLCMHVQFLNCL